MGLCPEALRLITLDTTLAVQKCVGLQGATTSTSSLRPRIWKQKHLNLCVRPSDLVGSLHSFIHSFTRYAWNAQCGLASCQAPQMHHSLLYYQRSDPRSRVLSVKHQTVAVFSSAAIQPLSRLQTTQLCLWRESSRRP